MAKVTQADVNRVMIERMASSCGIKRLPNESDDKLSNRVSAKMVLDYFDETQRMLNLLRSDKPMMIHGGKSGH